MTAACLLVRSPACSARQLQTSIVQVVHLCPTGFRKEPCERLERHKPKGLRVVLRGLGSSNAPRLPGTWVGNHPGLPGPLAPWCDRRRAARLVDSPGPSPAQPARIGPHRFHRAQALRPDRPLPPDARRPCRGLERMFRGPTNRPRRRRATFPQGRSCTVRRASRPRPKPAGGGS